MRKEIIKKEDRFLIKYFVFVFLLAFLIINWNEVSWIFNYQAVLGFVSDILKSDSVAQTNIDFQKQELKKEEPEKKFEKIEIEKNFIEIPRLGISAPLILVEKENEVQKALDRGVVLFPNSALPGKEGQTIILGHSAPLGWPKIKYDWIFSDLGQLSKGDEIFVYFDNKKFTYLVKNKIFLDKGEELPQDLTSSKNMIVLISCWPPGKDFKRIAVLAE